jgi:hypothetical protein
VKVDHDLDIGADGATQRLHHPPNLVDRGEGRRHVSVGDEHRLEGAIALFDDLPRALHQGRLVERLVDGAHVAETKMGVDADLVADLAAQEPPDGYAEVLPQYVPERDLDARHGAHSDSAESPEGMLAQDTHRLLDVPGVTPEQERGEVVDGSDDCLRLPLERRFAPAEQAGLVRLDLHEHPIAHLGVDDARADRRDLQERSLIIL